MKIFNDTFDDYLVDSQVKMKNNPQQMDSGTKQFLENKRDRENFN